MDSRQKASEFLCVSRFNESVIQCESLAKLDGELRLCRNPSDGQIPPLRREMTQRQPDQFSGGLVAGKVALVTNALAHAAVRTLDGVGGIEDLA